MVFEEFSDINYQSNDDKFIEEYVVVYSKYLLCNDFSTVKNHIASLARRGHIRSLAKYIKKVPPQERDSDLNELVEKIKNKTEAKTPQEWELLASIEWHSPVQNCKYEKIKTIQDLRNEISNSVDIFY
jgi:hypothetical protein